MAKNGTVKIQNDLGLVTRVIDEIIESFGENYSPKDIQAINVSLYEVIINAIEHGNLAIDSKIKNEALQKGTFDNLLKERMKEEPFASKKVVIEYLSDDKNVTFIITDEGEGFNWRAIPDPTKEENVRKSHGRGLLMVSSCMDEISFNEKGNKITITKYLGSV